MKNVSAAQTQASQRLSSGLRINSAADDAAGLAISEKMRSQIRGLDMASKNAQDATSLVQTAEGGMQQIDSMVQRMRELVVQASNDTNQVEDREKIGEELAQLTAEIDSMAKRVEFNEKKLLDGTTGTLYMQIGANESQGVEFDVGSMTTGDLGLGTIADAVKTATTGSEITGLISALDDGLKTVTTARSKLGAIQNRLDYTMKSLDISSENLSAAESRIRDTDMAKEMMNLTKTNVLSQAATSMLSQANQAPQNVLSLLK
jgi:flagellin